MGDSPPARFDQICRGGGDLHNNSPGRFEGVVTATTWGNRHCLYRRPRPEDARSGATRLLPAPWATPHPLGLIKFVEGGEDLHNNSPGRFEGVFACHNMGQPTLPLPPPTAGRRPFWGNALAARTMGDSPPARFDQIRQGGGDPFRGNALAAHTMGDSPTARFVLIRGGGVGIDPLG